MKEETEPINKSYVKEIDGLAFMDTQQQQATITLLLKLLYY